MANRTAGSDDPADLQRKGGSRWVAERLHELIGAEGHTLARLPAEGELSLLARSGDFEPAIFAFLAGLSRERDRVLTRQLRASRLPFFWSVSRESDLDDLFEALPREIAGELRETGYYVFFRRGQALGDMFLIARCPSTSGQVPMETLLACQGAAQMLFDDIVSIAPEPAIRISRRERECLRWSAEGKTSEEIALILSLSTHTVNHYLLSAIKKLNAVNRMHAIAQAFRLGVLDMSRDVGAP